ncbi:MAG: glycerol-phosphate dehydrogenase [Methanothermococcus sp.]|uniref:iron-containing alcohol dehydrogenase n=1 Tax=Methanothermococcus TaxID=155862 RepID=UPI000364707E|nr:MULTISPECIES: iron-containing alcohol dehydrogenase [Methanothermococcus]MDK2790210.1 glycerol-phosphate dehydrogenase [Methanothermococcus sp.]MDK2987187.1 glycerol-phosphate dehydrogenase [Methanothermococcus sp.]
MIVIPRYVLIEEKATDKIFTILSKLNLKKPLVITGKKTKKYNIGFEYLYYDEIDLNDLDSIVKNAKEYDSIIGIGGGKSLDIGKFISYHIEKPFISVPTTASNDGIASPIVSIKQPSFMAESPIAIIADVDIIKKSPKKLLSAGMGDIVSNITAVLDWKLAHKETGEKYSDSSGIFSKTIAMELIDYVLNSNLDEYPKKLVKALIASGITISIAHSSRPASGSEHLFSHALDHLKKEYDLKTNSLHGEQCGIGTIAVSYLHNQEDMLKFETMEKIKNSLEKVGAPIDKKGLGIDEDILIEALSIAHKIRDRHTILRNGLTKEQAREILEKTEII